MGLAGSLQRNAGLMIAFGIFTVGSYACVLFNRYIALQRHQMYVSAMLHVVDTTASILTTTPRASPRRAS